MSCCIFPGSIYGARESLHERREENGDGNARRQDGARQTWLTAASGSGRQGEQARELCALSRVLHTPDCGWQEGPDAPPPAHPPLCTARCPPHTVPPGIPECVPRTVPVSSVGIVPVLMAWPSPSMVSWVTPLPSFHPSGLHFCLLSCHALTHHRAFACAVPLVGS